MQFMFHFESGLESDLEMLLNDHNVLNKWHPINIRCMQ